MKTFTIKNIRSWKPYFDPSKCLPEGWSGTALDLVRIKEISFEDRLWVVMRPKLVPEMLMRLFALWCANQVQYLRRDVTSLKAFNEAPEASINAIRSAAYAISKVAMWAPARDATLGASLTSALATAQAAGDEHRAAWNAALLAQETKLIELLEAENK